MLSVKTDSYGNVVYGSAVTIGSVESVSDSDFAAGEIGEIYCLSPP